MNEPDLKSKTTAIAQARQRYNLPYWSDGFFDINHAGQLCVCPQRDKSRAYPLIDIIKDLRQQGASTPVLLRFSEILQQRYHDLCHAFAQTMQAQGYQGKYQAVYPIKVNQQYQVVETLLQCSDGRLGLEAGSKPEFLAILGMDAPRPSCLVCNGYKDAEYIRLALQAQRLGQNVIIIIEKLSEIPLIITHARALNIMPQLGVRVRLSSIAQGRWQNSGGERSKFGLSATQLLEAVESLKSAGMISALQCLHFHMGSQIANIVDITQAANEGAQFYVALRELGVPLAAIDVGGGLAVDYEGTRSRHEYSMNYSLQEYAKQIVQAVAHVCEEKKQPHPMIMTETGRALVAHHAVLITDIVDSEMRQQASSVNLQPQSQTSILESYHDASAELLAAQSAFMHGGLSLQQRAQVEQRFWQSCYAVRESLQTHSRRHRELLDHLEEKLAEKMFCNFSVFQSLPDIWAIQQIFPILPLTHCADIQTKRVILQDLTCDSDGQISQYVEHDGIENSLLLPKGIQAGDCLGIFLVGAYQEILGDMHNLFGDTHSVQVHIDDKGCSFTTEVGDSVSDVLRYVHFEPEKLLAAYERQVAASTLTETEKENCLATFAEGLAGYTYLERE